MKISSREYSDADILERIARLRNPRFFGELHVQSLGGKITTLRTQYTEKADREKSPST